MQQRSSNPLPVCTVAGGCGEGGGVASTIPPPVLLLPPPLRSSIGGYGKFHSCPPSPLLPLSLRFPPLTPHRREGGRDPAFPPFLLLVFHPPPARPPAHPFFYTKALGAQAGEKGRKADLSPLPRKKEEEDQYVLFLRIVSFSSKEDLPRVKAEKSCCMPFHTRKGKEEEEGEKRGEDRKFHGKNIFSWN